MMFKHLSYDPTSSTFLRFNQNWGAKIKEGQEAGSIKTNRIEVCVNKRSISSGRVVWELCKNEPVPRGLLVVPLDGNPFNLCIDNLRLMTRQQQRNYVSLVKDQGKNNVITNLDGTARSYFITRKDGKTKVEPLGTFPTTEEATEAYRRRKMKEVLSCG